MFMGEFQYFLRGFLDYGVQLIKLKDELKGVQLSLNQLDLIISCIKVTKVRLDNLLDDLYQRKKEVLRNEKTEVRKSSE